LFYLFFGYSAIIYFKAGILKVKIKGKNLLAISLERIKISLFLWLDALLFCRKKL